MLIQHGMTQTLPTMAWLLDSLRVF